MPSPDVDAVGKELATAAKGAAEQAAVATASSALATAGVPDWPAAWSAWQAPRTKADLRDHLQAGLPDLPGLDALIGKVSWSDEAGLLDGLDGADGDRAAAPPDRVRFARRHPRRLTAGCPRWSSRPIGRAGSRVDQTAVR